MRVFVAGASGVIGRPLVAQLLAAGHEVTGMTRRSDRAEAIEAAGARAVVCDVFDEGTLREAMAAARPQVLVHQLTALPQDLDLRRPDVYDATNWVRTEGTGNLLAAARDAGARRVVAQSVAFLYEPIGGPVKDEGAPTMTEAPAPFAGALAALADMERQVTGDPRLEGVILRYGFFYGPGTSYAADGAQAAMVRARRFPIVGRGNGVFSFVHVDDAAAATVAAVERGAPGTYNIVDDEPARLGDWLPVYAAALGAKRPMRVPKLLARLVAGPAASGMATTLRGASNAKAKRELGWQPLHASWRHGFREALRG